MESGWTGRTIKDIMPVEKGDWTVYMHIFPCVADNPVGHKVYVGICKRIATKRWGKDGNRYKTQHVYNAIKKYGWNNIVHHIVAEGCTHETACNLEKQFIKIYDARLGKCGYNATDGGDGVAGFCFTEEMRKKFSKAQQGKHLSDETRSKISEALRGKHLSDETRKKIGDALRGKLVSEETRKKLSEANSGKKHACYGKHLSDETRKKLSESQRKNAKQVLLIETGAIFNSLAEAASKTEISGSNISECCRGKRKTAGGYHWKYVEEE